MNEIKKLTTLEVYYLFKKKNNHISKKNMKVMHDVLKIYAYELINKVLCRVTAHNLKKIVNKLEQEGKKKIALKVSFYIQILIKFAKSLNKTCIS